MTALTITLVIIIFMLFVSSSLDVFFSPDELESMGVNPDNPDLTPQCDCSGSYSH